MLGSSPQLPPRVPEGPARPIGCCCAAFSSRSSTSPQAGQTWVRTLSDLGHARPTAATILAGVGGRHGDDPTPGACCLGFEDGAELRPTRIEMLLAEVTVPYHVGDPQIFEVNRVVLAQAASVRSCGGSRRAGAAPSDAALASQLDRLAPAVAPLLAARDTTLGLGELLLTTPVVARVLDRLPLRGDEEDLQAQRRCPSRVPVTVEAAGWAPQRRR